MLLTKSEHTISKLLQFSFLVSILSTKNIWYYDPPFGDQEREWPAFPYLGFPTEARVIIYSLDEASKIFLIMVYSHYHEGHYTIATWHSFE